MATDFSVLAWRIPWMEGPGGLQYIGLQRVEHHQATNTHTHIHTHTHTHTHMYKPSFQGRMYVVEEF